MYFRPKAFYSLFKHVYTMKIEFLDKSGKLKSRIYVKPIDFTTGEIKEIGNGAHILIKKKKAHEIGIGKTIGILFFEWNGGEK